MTPGTALFWHGSGTEPLYGLFVPKPSSETSCQGNSLLDLGSIVHWRPWASVVGHDGRYSLGYSVVTGQVPADWPIPFDGYTLASLDVML
jgi:hypothetical protein